MANKIDNNSVEYTQRRTEEGRKVKKEKAKECQKGSKYNEISIIAIMNVAKEKLKGKEEENKRSLVKEKRMKNEERS